MKTLLSSGIASMTAARITGDAGQLGMVAGFARGFFADDVGGLLCQAPGGTGRGSFDRDDLPQGDRRRGDLHLWFKPALAFKRWLAQGDRIVWRFWLFFPQHFVYRG